MNDLQQLRFHYRVAGVATHDGRVLLHRSENDDFWSLPGGRTQHSESAAAALRREMREELGAEVTVVRLLWVVENFFRERGEAQRTECSDAVAGLPNLLAAGADKPATCAAACGTLSPRLLKATVYCSRDRFGLPACSAGGQPSDRPRAY